MENERAVQEVVETGRELLEKGLVARTWGNVSARKDSTHFYITPSGLDYVSMKESDIVEFDMATSEWKGNHKPSGERGVHKAAYETFDDVSFVIHTHQNYATAIGLAGFNSLDITDEEREKLGGIAVAAYGLPGTKKLTDAVRSSLESGAKTVLMIHHGVLVCGKNKEEAMERVLLLEEICKRNVKGIDSTLATESEKLDGVELEKELKHTYSFVRCINTPEIMSVLKLGKPVNAQIDDMAQMIGRTIYITDRVHADKALEKHNAILVKGIGAFVRAEDLDDLDALEMLVEKTAIGKLHTNALKVSANIGMIDCILMHYIYIKKYSKQKKQ